METCYKPNYKINYLKCKIKYQGLSTKLNIDVNYLKAQLTWFVSGAQWSENGLCKQPSQLPVLTLPQTSM